MYVCRSQQKSAYTRTLKNLCTLTLKNIYTLTLKNLYTLTHKKQLTDFNSWQKLMYGVAYKLEVYHTGTKGVSIYICVCVCVCVNVCMHVCVCLH